MLVVLLTLFGIAPVLVWKYFRRERLTAVAPLAIQVTAVYGLTCYFLGPALGNLVDRLAGCGWPLFWIALPWLVRQAGLKFKGHDQMVLAACFLFASWWPSLIGFAADKAALLNPLPHVLLLIPYAVAFLVLRRTTTPLPG